METLLATYRPHLGRNVTPMLIGQLLDRSTTQPHPKRSRPFGHEFINSANDDHLRLLDDIRRIDTGEQLRGHAKLNDPSQVRRVEADQLVQCGLVAFCDTCQEAFRFVGFGK
jgi:hypothetical protein